MTDSKGRTTLQVSVIDPRGIEKGLHVRFSAVPSAVKSCFGTGAGQHAKKLLQKRVNRRVKNLEFLLIFSLGGGGPQRFSPSVHKAYAEMQRA